MVLSPFRMMCIDLLDNPIVPCNLMSKAWEPCSFTEVPDYSNILWVQEKGTQTGVPMGSQGFTLTQNMSGGFLPCCTSA